MSDRCYICNRDMNSMSSAGPDCEMTIVMEVFGVGSHERTFHVCESCGERSLVAFAADPFPQDVRAS